MSLSQSVTVSQHTIQPPRIPYGMSTEYIPYCIYEISRTDIVCDMADILNAPSPMK